MRSKKDICRFVRRRLSSHIGCARARLTASQAEAPVRFSAEPGLDAFLLSTQKAAAGLTLTAATHVFLLDPLLSPGVEMQAVNRAHRGLHTVACGVCVGVIMT